MTEINKSKNKSKGGESIDKTKQNKVLNEIRKTIIKMNINKENRYKKCG